MRPPSSPVLAASLVFAAMAAACCPPDSTDEVTACTRAVAIGDLDGDGVEDLAFTTRFDPLTEEDRFSSWIISGARDVLLYRVEVRREAERPVKVRAWPPGLHRVEPLGDIDGDGRADLAIVLPGSPFDPPRPGTVCLLSGPTGKLLGRYDDTGEEGGFGRASTVLEHGPNGSRELAVTGRGRFLDGVPGRVVVLSMPECAARNVAKGPAVVRHADPAFPNSIEADSFGSSIAALSDLDGDGVSDYAVGAQTAGAAGVHAGQVHGYSGASGERLYSIDGQPGQFLGAKVAGVGDQDGDGTIDFLATSFRRPASIRSGRDGSVIGAMLPLQIVEPAGDVDGDGAIDIVGLRHWVYPGEAIDPAQALVVSGRTRAVLLRLPLPEGRGFVFAFARAGDIDGDGHDELMVVLDPLSEWRCSAGWAPFHGEVRIHSGRDGRLVKSIDRQALRSLAQENREAVVLDAGRHGR